jgi:putative glycosyltransferase (TIGR04372 family)
MSVPLRYGAPLQWLTDRVASGARPVLEAAKHGARRRGWRHLDRTFDRWGHVCRDVSHRYERLVTSRWHDLFAEARERARATGSKREPLRLELRPSAQRRVNQLLQRAGLDSSRPIVTLHVRESGFRQRDAARQQEIDRIRDARIDTYRQAVDWVVARGYQVVRIGDPTMTPCDWPGTIDLATAPWRSGEFELWTMLHSRFFIASDSGPYFLGHLARVPVLAVNVIQVGYYTVRRQDRYICKRVYDRVLARHLTIAEMLTERFIRNPLDLNRYEWIDNSPEDIREAVQDFVALLDGAGGPLTPVQQHHDDLLAEVADQWRPEWRTRRSLAFRRGGQGTISAGFASRYLTSVPTGVP